jgi:hypothetical protein
VSTDDGATSAVVSIISIEGRGEGGEGGVYISKRSDRLVVDDAIDRVT